MMEKLYTTAEIEQTDKGMLAIASTSITDRHEEVVDVDGWDLKNFKKNPILQWSHDPYEIAIGTAKNIRVEGEGKKKRLVFEPVFHEVTEKARAIKKLFEDGVLRAFSVGFKPLEVDGNRYLSNELLEISAVNVPANPEALMLAYKSLDGFSDDVKIELGMTQQIVKSMREEMDQRLQEMEIAVKEVSSASQLGRNADSAKRQKLLKAVDKIAESIHSDAKAGKATNPIIAKALDKAVTILLTDNKRELREKETIGKNQRTTYQS